MARRKVEDGDPSRARARVRAPGRDTAGASVRGFLSHGKRAAPRRVDPVDRLGAIVAEAERRGADGEWEGAGGGAFVGLYAFCHRAVYGVLPEELGAAAELRSASGAASRLLREAFDGDESALVDFIRWTWLREKDREEWARRENVPRGRLGWRLQFSSRLVTDYRVDASRRRGGRR